MRRDLRPSFARLAVAGTAATLLCMPLACGALLGIDDGSPVGDAAVAAPDSDFAIDAASDAANDGAIDGANDGASSSDGTFQPDGGFHVDAEAGCTPDLSWCNTHCGTGPDNCNVTRACPSDCSPGQACVSNACACQSNPNWCAGRCLGTTDNCGQGMACPSCAAGVTCFNGACGCMPDAPTKTCGTQQCGQATNNCGLTVNCGLNGTTACPSNEVCLAATNQCCAPDNASACGNQCQVTVTNNCGQTVACPQTCPNNGVCVKAQCCTPSACSGNCVDNCGQQNASCCFAPPDSGQPPPIDAGGGQGDAGSCTAGGSKCASSAACCTGMCGYFGSCVPTCGGPGGPCSSSTQCCVGLSCQLGVVTTQQIVPIQPFDGGVVTSGFCQ